MPSRQDAPVTVHVARERRTVGARVDGQWRRGAVERGQVSRDAAQVVRPQRPGTDRTVEHVGGRQATHPDQPVDDDAVRAEVQLSARIDAQRHDAEVDVGRETAVQAHLSVTIAASRAKRSGIEGRETNGFLELVCVVGGQEYPGHMGFNRIDPVRRPWKAPWPGQEGEFGLGTDLRENGPTAGDRRYCGEGRWRARPGSRVSHACSSTSPVAYRGGW